MLVDGDEKGVDVLIKKEERCNVNSSSMATVNRLPSLLTDL